MRVAVLIIGLLLGLLMFLQSVLVYGLSDATNADDTDAMAVGVMVALLWLIACAFVFRSQWYPQWFLSLPGYSRSRSPASSPIWGCGVWFP